MADGATATKPLPPVLELRRVHAAYGQIEVLHGIDLAVTTGSVLALLGPNGAGKSTALKVASGQMVPTAGCFHVMGRHANGTKPDALSRAGLCTLPDGRGIFPNLTVTENLRLMTLGGASRAVVEERAFARFPRLAERRTQVAGTLSGGEQQMLALSRALTSAPKLLLLDEISMGLAPLLVEELFGVIKDEVKNRTVSVLIVEQLAEFALAIADQAVVLSRGSVVATGTPQEVKAVLAEAYLGHDDEADQGTVA
jgi:branched-chain amino acid transport system ATP-binding protein